MDPRPDLGGGDAVILEPERDVVAGARHDELGLGVLEHEAGTTSDRELALLLARALVQQPGEREEQRALPSAGRSY
jgi:hypothetical protein